ncbi:MAG: hypothetical protein ACI9NT_001275 [Bacteroidia bacterium]|jgi:hypothetical protein
MTLREGIHHRCRTLDPADLPYQAKCLRWSKERHRALSKADRASVDALVEGTGVEAMLWVD